MTDGTTSDLPGEFREWISYESADDETVLVDATFLTGTWRCSYGCGCPGIEEDPAPELARGCCSYGAHLTDADDRKRVEAAAARLTTDRWQLLPLAETEGAFTVDAEGAEVTRVVDGACIFLNRGDFAAGPGCALHSAALELDEQPLDWKPDVCWQIPIRVEETVDENGHTTKTLRAWLRRDWGEGGADLGWWCTEPNGSFDAEEPVFRSLAGELQALLGAEAYAALAARLDEA